MRSSRFRSGQGHEAFLEPWSAFTQSMHSVSETLLQLQRAVFESPENTQQEYFAWHEVSGRFAVKSSHQHLPSLVVVHFIPLDEGGGSVGALPVAGVSPF